MSTSPDMDDSIDLNMDPLAVESPEAGVKRRRAVPVGDLPARNLFDEMTAPAPDDPAYYDEHGHGYGEALMADMINGDGQTETQEATDKVVTIDDEPLFADELARQAAAQPRA